MQMHDNFSRQTLSRDSNHVKSKETKNKSRGENSMTDMTLFQYEIFCSSTLVFKRTLSILPLFSSQGLLTMKFLSVYLLALIVITVSGQATSFPNKVEDLKRAFSAVLDDTSRELAGLTARLEDMEAERAELDRAHAWQALHMAAAAACRGSTASGGRGPLGNAVLAKENTRSCNQVCIAEGESVGEEAFRNAIQVY